MHLAIRQSFHAYASRRSPWGPPWWVYGVSYGVLNLTRQAVIMLAATETSTPVRIASWAATALVVILVVNAVAAVLHRREVRRDGRAVRVHEMAHPVSGPKEEAA